MCTITPGLFPEIQAKPHIYRESTAIIIFVHIFRVVPLIPRPVKAHRPFEAD
jgi:hypothetical protein